MRCGEDQQRDEPRQRRVSIRQQCVLHRKRRDLFARTIDYLLEATREKEPAMGVLPPLVACPQPPPGRKRAAVRVAAEMRAKLVPLHHARASHGDLALLAHPLRLVGGRRAQHGNLWPCRRPDRREITRRRLNVARTLSKCRTDGKRLGHAVRRQHLHAGKRGLEAKADGRGESRAAISDELNGVRLRRWWGRASSPRDSLASIVAASVLRLCRSEDLQMDGGDG